MKRSEIFQEVLAAVADCIEIPQHTILSDSRVEDVVMARCIIVHYGMLYGLNRKALQDALMLKSHNSIRYYIEVYSNRYDTDRYFRSTANYIGQKLGKTMAATGQ